MLVHSHIKSEQITPPPLSCFGLKKNKISPRQHFPFKPVCVELQKLIKVVTRGRREDKILLGSY
jgi:hypothetical protein